MLYLVVSSGSRSARRCLWIVTRQHHGREQSDLKSIVFQGTEMRNSTAHDKYLAAHMLYHSFTLLGEELHSFLLNYDSLKLQIYDLLIT